MHLELAELQICAQTKERADAWDKAHVGGHGYVAGFDEFHYLVFLAFVFEFQVLLVVVETGIGVVVDVHVDFVSDFGVDGEVDFHVKVKSE